MFKGAIRTKCRWRDNICYTFSSISMPFSSLIPLFLLSFSSLILLLSLSFGIGESTGGFQSSNGVGLGKVFS